MREIKDFSRIRNWDNVTPEMIIDTWDRDGWIFDKNHLKFVPEKLRTEEVCHSICKRNGAVLEFVPDRHRTEAICLDAVKSVSCAIKAVPDSLLTEEFCLKAGKLNIGIFNHLEFQSFTQDICDLIMEKSPSSFRFIPDKFKKYSYAWKAVEFIEKSKATRMDIVQTFPVKYLTPEICKAIVLINEEFLFCIPKNLEDFCSQALKNPELTYEDYKKTFLR